MELDNQKKLAKHIFRLLKVQEIVFPIGRTNSGNLGIKFSANNEEYEIMLDAVPLSTNSVIHDENNIELKKMLEKYWFEHSSVSAVSQSIITATHADRDPLFVVTTSEEIPKKKGGRPKGSKNRK